MVLENLGELKIGLMGGSFDPVHNGHIALAQCALEQLELDRVVMIPAGKPPHKRHSTLSDSKHRWAMMERAVEGIAGIEASRIELDLPGISYTVNTLRMLREQLGISAELTLIIGADQLLDLENWRESVELFRLCRIAVAHRPGCEMDQVNRQMHRLKEIYNASLVLLKAPLMDVSATEIRQHISTGESAAEWLSEGVWEYIQKEHLYVG